MTDEKKIVRYRKELDEIDDKLVELIKKRIVAAQKIVSEKKSMGLSVEDAAREGQIIKRLTKDKKTAPLVEDIFRRIFSWVKSL
jgi:chorismate mutase